MGEEFDLCSVLLDGDSEKTSSQVSCPALRADFLNFGAACPIGKGQHPVSRKENSESRAARPTPGKSFYPCISRVFRRYGGDVPLHS